MKKVAVLIEYGFEEMEALITVDVLRRANITCHMISLNDYVVKGCHRIQVISDYLTKEIDKNDYDMLVLPGGLPGADNLMNSSEVIDWVKDFASRDNKYIAAICAAPQVLAKANVIRNKKITSYPSDVFLNILKDGIYTNELVVRDDNIITSRGPATALPFAYKLVEVLGGDCSSLKDTMLYNELL